MRQHPHCIGGATGFIDRQILGLKHLYQWPTAKSVYDSEAFDPEGVLCCLPTILHAFIGLQAGVTLVVFTCYKARMLRWITWAVVLGLAGGLLCNFSQNGGVIPVNKNLWSLSFVLVTSSLAFVGLTICNLLIDVKNWWQGAPFIYPGMNAIIMYVGHSFLHSTLPWR
jgi:heparan-alpha-glucosaminide N-acetyltransferase